MVFIEVCVGSSCHIKGAPDIVALLEEAIKKHGAEDDVMLSGSFCTGKCNRVGVTVTVNDETYTGITRENFYEFWNEKVMPVLQDEGR